MPTWWEGETDWRKSWLKIFESLTTIWGSWEEDLKLKFCHHPRPLWGKEYLALKLTKWTRGSALTCRKVLLHRWKGHRTSPDSQCLDRRARYQDELSKLQITNCKKYTKFSCTDERDTERQQTLNSLTEEPTTGISDICPFWYNATLIRLVKSTPKSA